MFFKEALSSFLVLASCLNHVTAHPGEHHDHQEVADSVAKRELHAAAIARGMQDCLDHPSYVALQEEARHRRWVKAKELRAKRGIPLYAPYNLGRRSLKALEKFEKESYNYTDDGYTTTTASKKLFAHYKNSSCILTPEVTQGPYYVTGEYVRSNVTDGQAGVPVHLEYQYIDISTCKPATGLYVETWQANATGVYSGIVASGNGVGTDDPSNINNTFLRGIQPVNKKGLATFDTIFVGHYAGRASHIHIIAQHDGTLHKKNNTYTGGTISHVGQLFFPMSLRDAVEATSPYSTNTQSIVTNDEDMWAPDQADNGYDPFPDYVYLGDDITDGLLMWISIGINMTASYTAAAAAELTKNGGVALSDSGVGGGGSSMTGSVPTGAIPTGSMASGGAPPSGASGSTSAAATTTT